MKRSRLLYLILLVSSLLFSSVEVQSAPLDWQPVASGVAYRQYTLAGPNTVFVARMDRTDPSVILDSSVGSGKLVDGRETVRSQAARYNGSLNSWDGGWGGRNRVVAAINGYYFDPTTGYPWRGQVQSGWYIKRFDNLENGSGFVWKSDRSAFIGECVDHPESKQVVTFADGSMLPINGVNARRESGQLILYTPHWDSNTGTDEFGVEVLVELPGPAQIFAKATSSSVGIVRSVRPNAGSTAIPFDGVILSGQGTTAGSPGSVLREKAREGDSIRISQMIRHYAATDCQTPLDSLSWDKAYASIGGAFYFLRDGQIQKFTSGQANVQDARTAIAFNDAYIFFIVVDGWDPKVSIGMNMDQLGRFARDTLGAQYGIAQDGGESATLVVNGEVKNAPYCNMTHKCGLPAAPTAEPGQPEAAPPLVNPQDLFASEASEPAVANGLMMIVVEPKVQFAEQPFQRSQNISAAANLRLGPGTDYGVLATIPAGAQISPVAHPLNGVYAKNYSWWKVMYQGIEGWLAIAPDWPHQVSLPLVRMLPSITSAANISPFAFP